VRIAGNHSKINKCFPFTVKFVNAISPRNAVPDIGFSRSHPEDIWIGRGYFDGTYGGGGKVIRYTAESHTVVICFPYAAMPCGRVKNILVGRIRILRNGNIGDPCADARGIEIPVLELTE